MGTSLYDNNGSVAVANMDPKLLKSVIDNMKSTKVGNCVSRQFVYGKEYLFLILNVRSDIDSPKTHIEVALWPDSDFAQHSITRDICFTRTEGGIRTFESFCERASGGKAIWERDLIGNFFMGHISEGKSRYNNQNYYFENLIVDKYVGRIDPTRANDLIVSKPVTDKTPKHKTIVADLLAEDDD